MHTTPDTSALTTATRPLAADRLRMVLLLNAATSTLGGAAALMAGGPVAELLGTRHADRVRIAGAGLLLFGIALLALARQPAAMRSRVAPAVSAVDLTWVAATFLAVTGGWFSTRGDVVMGLVGLAVLDVAIAQIWFARGSAA